MARKVHATGAALRQSEHGSREYVKTHDIVAVSPTGKTLWETDSVYAHGPDPEEYFNRNYGDTKDIVVDGTEVSHFELREV